MTLPRLFAPVRPALWAALAALALAQAVALVAGVAGTRLAFSGLDAGAVPPTALALIAGAALALAVLRPALRLMAEGLGQAETRAIRAALFRHALASPPEALAGRRRGYLMLRLTGDMTTLKDGIARSLPPILQAAALTPAAIVALAMIDARLAALGLGLAVLTLAALALARTPLRTAHAALRRERARLVAAMAERLPIAPDLARLGRGRAELARLAAAGQAVSRRAAARLIRVEALRALPGGLAGLAAAAVLIDGAARGLTAGEIAAALAAIGIMAHAMLELATAIDRLASWRIAHDNLARHLATGAVAASPPDAPGRTRLGRGQGALTATAAPGLMQPATIDLAPGARGTVAGPDPDRLLRLLSGQARDAQIAVQLDGLALDTLSAGSLRRNIAVVGPSPVVLKGSLRRNICLGLTERPADATLIRRIERAGLGGALDRLGGLDGAVPEGGRTLPPADLLRLSALRAAVQRPRVLLVAPQAGPLPADVQRFLDGTDATVLRIAAAVAEVPA
jgi:ABC-type multidrug transport system fused ATPase/permease subunit